MKGSRSEKQLEQKVGQTNVIQVSNTKETCLAKGKGRMYVRKRIEVKSVSIAERDC